MKTPQAPAGVMNRRKRMALLQDFDASLLPLHAQALAGQRVLLSGTSGQVGVWLLRLLLKAGAKVDAVAFRTALDFTHPNLRWHSADLTEADALASLAASDGIPPIVLFCAPLWFLTPQLPSLEKAGVKRIIAFSSTSMHVKADSAHPREREVVARLRAGEDALHDFAARRSAQVTILRPTMIYGLGLDANVGSVARVLKRLRFFPVAWNADGMRQPVHVDDLVRAVFACLAMPEQTASKAYDLSGGEVLPYRDFVQRIAALPGVGGIALPVPFLAEMLDLIGRMVGKPDKIHGEIARRMRQDLAFPYDAAEQDFGYSPRAFLDATRQPAGIDFLTRG